MKTKILLGASLILLVTLAGLILLGNMVVDTQDGTNEPVTNTTSNQNFNEISTKLRLGVTSENFGGIEITPIQVISDSRCASDVTCIWAGTVNLKTRVKIGTSESEVSLTLGEEKKVGIYSITLTAVEPGTHSQRTINPRDYEFSLKITKGTD